jgi:hypothetical protein
MNFRLCAATLLVVASVCGGRSDADPPRPPALDPAQSLRTLTGKGARSSAAPGYRSFVDMQTFMDHVLSPAATIIWRTNGFINDSNGDHDLSPKTDADWELVVSGAATLAEATNALRIPQRSVDSDWNGYVDKLADAAAKAYEAAEKHDLPALFFISDHLDEICSSCHRHYGFE